MQTNSDDIFFRMHKDTKAQPTDPNDGNEVCKQQASPTASDTKILGDIDVDVMDGLDDEVLPAQKPHFLDYDAVPPPDFEEKFERVLTFGTAAAAAAATKKCEGERLKVDKKYERDGEISDFELAASGYTKKEFTQDDNTLHLPCGGVDSNAGGSGAASSLRKSVFAKPKHFLDENPIPPDYMLKQELREHRSLDRNFERQSHSHTPASPHANLSRERTESPKASSADIRNVSLDRSSSAGGSSTRSSRERFKEPSYTLSRFLDSDPKQISCVGGAAGLSSPASLPPLMHSMTSANAWTDSFDSRYGSLQLPTTMGSGTIFPEVVDTLGPKVECVYSLLSMLGSNDPVEMSKKFLELSRTPETCATLRRSGCIPLLVQIMHSSDGEENVRKWAGMALHNVVHSHPDEKAGRREAKVLRLLDQIIDYCNFLKTLLQSGGEAIADDSDRHPLAAISSLMKVSFDEEHRHAMCELGALQAIPNLVHLDHAVHGPKPEDQCCNSLRRYALMALTNLTFGDENNKALLCSQKVFMEALVAQLDSAPDDLLQVTASVLRNLSWRADANMKAVLNEIGTVTALARAAMKNKCENTLKAILSALWNLSAHCSTNKAEFCAVNGALAFLVKMLTYEGPSKTLKIIENAGGILRNVSSHIAVREHYRQILREHNCLAILLQQLKSESLTVVSNSCGTLWNLSARCPEDQKFLWDNGAVPMLRSLIHSKHAMISEGSSSALKNLLNFRPSVQNQSQLDPIARSMGLKKLPTLNARKQKALEQELEEKEHSETCDNLDVIGTRRSKERTSHLNNSTNYEMQRRGYPLAGAIVSAVVAGGNTVPAQPSVTRLTRSAMLTKSESRDSIFSAKSDSVYENLMMRSHSASDTNRSKAAPANQIPQQGTVSGGQHLPRRAAASAFVGLDNEVEAIEEQPIDYSIKYKEDSSKRRDSQQKSSIDIIDLEREGSNVAAGGGFTVYQETDLDQPTDFSLRYAENQIESDADISPPDADIDAVTASPSEPTSVGTNRPPNEAVAAGQSATKGNEIILILEDSVKCYQTEDTPYVISNAASVTDLRQNSNNTKSTKNEESLATKGAKCSDNTDTHNTVSVKGKYQPMRAINPQHGAAGISYGSGSYTPEKPINYCEEGTPGYFSRYESLSSLDESPPSATAAKLDSTEHREEISKTQSAVPQKSSDGEEKTDTKDIASTIEERAETPPPKHSNDLTGPQINSAQETPLMFSRHSSMDSLVEEDVGPCDDKSSVISDFSRLASGVISPSDLPDSPTQSMPQSPRRNSGSGMVFSSGMSPVTPRGVTRHPEGKRPNLRSVFEDNVNAFDVENTPAQFSCATSLSNLSIMDDEQNSPPSADAANNEVDVQQQQRQANKESSLARRGNTSALSEGDEEEEEEEEVGAATNDDLLLASCINMGMKRAPTINSPAVAGSGRHSSEQTFGKQQKARQSNDDETQHYYTEDTPALLSKVGSNSNLSAISICSSNADLKGSTSCDQAVQRSERLSLNLSDVESSNASESGGCSAVGPSILEQCIRDGMKKPQQNLPPTHQQHQQQIRQKFPTSAMDPIDMMRRGGNSLPPYLPVTDEMSRFVVEDSPCNFSVVSGLSNLTVGSSLVGPAVQLQESRSGGDGGTVDSVSKGKAPRPQLAPPIPPQRQEKVRRDQQQPEWQDDSLSSLSIDSEDDTNLLSQTIAAGCNRPKSNLGFSTSNGISSKRSSSLSASQPIPINSATSASSLNAASSSKRHHHHHHHHGTGGLGKREQQPDQNNHGCNGNESSFSSVDSSDSNDNQSKSLFELCIMTGMQKGTNRDSRKQHHQNAQQTIQHHHHNHLVSLNANVTQSNPNLKQPYGESASSTTKHSVSGNRHLRERERKDERLLMECINTGITKKINGSGGNVRSGGNSLGYASNDIMENMNANPIVREQLAFTANAVSKNVQATSAAASEQYHRTEDTTFPSAPSTAAPDVENTNNSNSNISISKTPFNNITSNLLDDITSTEAPRNHPRPHPQIMQDRCDEGHRNREIVTPETMNDIGCNDLQNTDSTPSNSLSLDNTTSDESNQSFIMETTISLDPAAQPQKEQIHLQNQTDAKHKDPDLMLKSVERLTLEFVSSAEQLRTNGGSSDSHEMPTSIGKRMGSISLGVTSNSNNTWNEDTCPNDVSFPSISVTAPVVASLKSDDSKDDNEADYDDEQATEADHREFHDFAEITPTNEEQPPPPSLMIIDEMALNMGGTQPNSLGTETETDTLVNKSFATEPLTNTLNTNSNSSSSGINFKLGGEVQSAAVAVAANRNLFFNSTNTMTNSTIIAIEARVLADNLQCQRSTSTEPDELTFSLTSLDLDNVRPPSGMDSLNISGYYQQDLTPGCTTQPNSLQRFGCGPLMGSPKLPRKSLPAGLVAKRALGHLPGHLSGSTDSVNSSCNLLDNIKPPSLMDELLDSMISVASIQSEVADCESMATTMTGSAISQYETAAGCNEFDDNTVTLQSCCDNMLPRDDDDDEDDDDDRTAKSSTPLPSDGDFSSAETTPKKSSNNSSSGGGVRRTLTPKQKRKMAKDRFKTYTIAADIVLGATTADGDDNETLQIEIVESAGKPDRYQTQTIEYPKDLLPPTDVFTSFVISCDEQANSSLTSTDDYLSDDVSSIRAMTQQFKYITAPAPVPIAETQPDVRNGYADNLESSEYCDQNSETESCHDEQQHHQYVGHEGSGDDEHEEEKTQTAKPRIVKPDDKDANDDDNDEAEANGQSPKSVRGRKKPAYISPYSMQYQRNTALVTRLTTNKLITTTVAPTSAVFRKRNTNNAATLAQTTTKIAQKKKTTEVVPAATDKPAALERQGTFVKDEPTNASVEVPIVEAHAASTSTTTSPQSSPSHKRTSKLPMKQQAQTNKTTAAYAPKAAVATAVVGAAVRRVVSQQMTANTQRSNSNASIRVSSSSTSRVMRVSATTPPSRSNSNVNSAAAANSAATAATKIHQAQSRIAGMWKRVDEAKKAKPANTSKQKQESTTSRISNMRRPPTVAQKSHGDSGPRKLQQPQSMHKPTLIRSSTFDNTPALEGAVTTPIMNGSSCNGNETKSKIAITRNIAGGNRHISARK